MIRRPPRSPLFPYTPLSRSGREHPGQERRVERQPLVRLAEPPLAEQISHLADQHIGDRDRRSEEHTSELQSHLNLVCRLLLEKKKNKKQSTTIDRRYKRKTH